MRTQCLDIHLPLLLSGEAEVDVVHVPLHLVQLLRGDLQPELLLRLRQPGPQLAPSGELKNEEIRNLSHYVVM